jgi:hypothetical protein
MLYHAKHSNNFNPSWLKDNHLENEEFNKLYWIIVEVKERLNTYRRDLAIDEYFKAEFYWEKFEKLVDELYVKVKEFDQKTPLQVRIMD